jgi:predicted XRE-type DNA-binding protein
MEIYKNLNLQDLDDETWKDILGYEGDYQVSNLGRIKSFKKHNCKILNQYRLKSGHLIVDLWKNGMYKNKQVHRLVFEIFNNYKLKDDECVHHIDEKPENNIFENLKLMPENEHKSLHRKGEKNPSFGKIGKNSHNFGKYHSKEIKIKISEKNKGENNSNHKLTEEQIIKIKLLLKEEQLTQQEIADMFGVNRITISDIKTGRTWNYIKI